MDCPEINLRGDGRFDKAKEFTVDSSQLRVSKKKTQDHLPKPGVGHP